jgi:hypothetical protein
MVTVVGSEVVMRMNSDNRQREHDCQWSMVDAVVSVVVFSSVVNKIDPNKLY